MKCLVVVFAMCFVSTVYADKVIEGIRNIGPQQSKVVARSARFAGEDCDKSIRVKDARHAAEDCSVTWYELDVDCFGTVQFKGITDCSKPESIICTESGKKVKFTSGHSVEITKKNGKVVVDYDR